MPEATPLFDEMVTLHQQTICAECNRLILRLVRLKSDGSFEVVGSWEHRTNFVASCPPNA